MDGGSRVVGVDTPACRLGQNDVDTVVVDVVVDGACGIAATTDTGHEHVGIVAPGLLPQLPFDLLGDDALHPGHDVGIGMRPHGGAYDIERVGGMAAPVADGLGACVAERHIACGHGMHLGAKHPHALHIGVLPLHIGLPHEDLTLHVHQRAHGGGSHAMLSGSCLGDDARLAHLPCHENLSDGVVDLVRARVVEVLTLQIELAPVFLAHSPGEI